jgi:hypothetical protein
MKKLGKRIIITLSIIALFIAGGIYFLFYFFSAFTPPKLTITSNYISTNRDFINGLTIEKIKVDSIGGEGFPVKYTITYLTSCHIDHPLGKPPRPPDKIYYKKEGKYWWTEEDVKIPIIHEGLSRRATNSTTRPIWSMSGLKLKSCPIEFEKEQWYFITISEPQVTGIFFYIDKNGNENQFYLTSGVSPI